MDAITAPSTVERIRALNDRFRQSFMGGKVMRTASVAALPVEQQMRIMMAVQQFVDFDEDNDPHGEHDCASFEFDGETFMFKIDYYDPSMEAGSEAPDDPAKTTRVLTIMFASDY